MDGAVAGAAPHFRDSAGRQVITTAMTKGKNARSALLLLLMALVFFVAIMVKVGWLGQ